MTIQLRDRGVRAVLLDIEGTTTPITFVTEVLFPYARRHLAAYLGHDFAGGEAREAVERLRTEHAADVTKSTSVPAWRDDDATASAVSVGAYVTWLMDRDRKSPGLKLLQGFVWERGYQAGELRGLVFPDVPGALRGWHEAGIDLAIYSSGSVLAQLRLFESTEAGDLTPLFKGFFDTGVGAKVEAASYGRIARELGHAPGQILFLSDVAAELSAAQSARYQVALVVRPGNAVQPGAERFDTVEKLDQII